MENLYILIAAFVTAVTLGRMIIPNINDHSEHSDYFIT